MKITETSLFLISVITNDTKQPIFIADDQIFGINFFNQWKYENGLEHCVCQIEPINFIKKSDYEHTDIQTSMIGDLNGN